MKSAVFLFFFATSLVPAVAPADEAAKTEKPAVANQASAAEAKAPVIEAKTQEPKPVEIPFEVGQDRIVTTTTSQTLPKGVFSFSDYEIALLQLSYGITDDLQFSVMASVPIIQFALVPSIKWRFFHNERIHLALTGYVGGVILYAVNGYGGYLAGLTLSMDTCIDKKCSSIFTINSQGGYGWDSQSISGGAGALAFNTGFIVKLAGSLKLLIELNYGMSPKIDHSTFQALNLNYGLRIHGKQFAADIAFLRPLFYVDHGNVQPIGYAFFKYVPLGIPYLAFTYQW